MKSCWEGFFSLGCHQTWLELPIKHGDEVGFFVGNPPEMEVLMGESSNQMGKIPLPCLMTRLEGVKMV
jgi:hypothetical protein